MTIIKSEIHNGCEYLFQAYYWGNYRFSQLFVLIDWSGLELLKALRNITMISTISLVVGHMYIQLKLCSCRISYTRSYFKHSWFLKTCNSAQLALSFIICLFGINNFWIISFDAQKMRAKIANDDSLWNENLNPNVIPRVYLLN